MKSWKTTTCGIFAAISGYLVTVQEPSWIPLAGKIMGAASMALMGLVARDNDKSSEDVGSKEFKK